MNQSNCRNAIVYISDINFANAALASIRSFERELDSDTDIILGLVDAEENERDEFIDIVSRMNRPHIFMREVEIPHEISDRNNSVWPAAVMGKFFLSKFIPKNYKRILLLDSDTMPGQSRINFQINLGGSVFGAVQDHSMLKNRNSGIFMKQPGKNPRYFNAGTMLIDWPKWLQDCVEEKCINMFTSGEDFFFPEQDVMNILYENDWFELDPTWNFQTDFLQYPYRRSEIKVYHYCGPRKPWSVPSWHEDGGHIDLYRKNMIDQGPGAKFQPATFYQTWRRRFKRFDRLSSVALKQWRFLRSQEGVALRSHIQKFKGRPFL